MLLKDLHTKVCHFFFCLCLLIPIGLRGQVLYEISGNGVQHKSFLLATNRLTDISFLDSVPNVFAVFSKCDCVITEFAMQDFEAIAALRQAALLPDSIRLQQYFSKEEEQQIDDALRLALNMGFDKIGRMRPAFLVELYRTELMRRWLGFDEQRSEETFFEKIAQQQSMPVYGLDDVGETMYMMFEREPVEWQYKELKNITEYPEREVRQEKSILQLYKSGRINEISIQVQSPDNKSVVSYSDYKVYCERNREWVKRLKPYLKSGKAFITLNAVFLGGNEGVIALLKETGYKVRAVNK